MDWCKYVCSSSIDLCIKMRDNQQYIDCISVATKTWLSRCIDIYIGCIFVGCYHPHFQKKGGDI